jgi:CNT family concentrative nucleoside transporter
MQRFQGLFGIVLILGLALLFSNNRRRINLRLVCSGLLLQLLIAVLVLRVEPVTRFFQFLGRGMERLEHFALCTRGLPYPQGAAQRKTTRWADSYLPSM